MGSPRASSRTWSTRHAGCAVAGRIRGRGGRQRGGGGRADGGGRAGKGFQPDDRVGGRQHSRPSCRRSMRRIERPSGSTAGDEATRHGEPMAGDGHSSGGRSETSATQPSIEELLAMAHARPVPRHLMTAMPGPTSLAREAVGLLRRSAPNEGSRARRRGWFSGRSIPPWVVALVMSQRSRRCGSSMALTPLHCSACAR